MVMPCSRSARRPSVSSERSRPPLAAFPAVLRRHPDAWQGYYNAACIEARFGDPETAIEHLEIANGNERLTIRFRAAINPELVDGVMP